MMVSTSLINKVTRYSSNLTATVRFVSMDVIEKAVGKRAATEFIQSMELNSKMIVSKVLRIIYKAH